MRSLIRKILFPFRLSLVFLLPVINIALIPLKIISFILKLGLGMWLISFLFLGEPLGEVISGLWLIFIVYVILEIILAIPQVLAEMASR